MSLSERNFLRITSIPPRTSLDVLRGGVAIRVGEGRLAGGVVRVSQKQQTAEEPYWNVAKHVFKKPPRPENARLTSPYERDGKIECIADIIEDYNAKEDLGITMQFYGIELTGKPFIRGIRDYGPDSAVFYAPIGYKNKIAYLIFATRGDIFKLQIVPAQMDVNPFFQRELHLPQLTTTHDPTTMTVPQNNNVVIVAYNPLSTR